MEYYLYCVIAIEALLTLGLAFCAWRKYRFEKWTFIPMLLLVEAPHFIFPIYLYLVKKKVMEVDADKELIKSAKVNYIKGWGVVLFYILSYLIIYGLWFLNSKIDHYIWVMAVAIVAHLITILYILSIFRCDCKK